MAYDGELPKPDPEDKPLHVRVCIALGWEDCQPWRQPRAHVPWEWQGRVKTLNGWDYATCLPYGSYSPEGWLLTGPLLDRFKLDVWKERMDPVVWYASQDVTFTEAKWGGGASACEAIADWVAQYGAEAIKAGA